jgi:hypothetical protein
MQMAKTAKLLKAENDTTPVEPESTPTNTDEPAGQDDNEQAD